MFSQHKKGKIIDRYYYLANFDMSTLNFLSGMMTKLFPFRCTFNGLIPNYPTNQYCRTIWVFVSTLPHIYSLFIAKPMETENSGISCLQWLDSKSRLISVI